MSKLTRFTEKIFKNDKKTFIKYVLLFWAMMMIIYLYLIYAGMAVSPTFTYAEF